WVQLLSANGQDLQVDEGFSGGGVWDEQAGQFAGIMVANKRRGDYVKSVSYMIPTLVLKGAWTKLPVQAPTSPSPTHPTSPADWVPAGARRIRPLTYAKGLFVLVAAAALAIAFFGRQPSCTYLCPGDLISGEGCRPK